MNEQLTFAFATPARQTTQPTPLQSLRSKLRPSWFTAMSPQMAALVGYIVQARFTSPQITEVFVTCDGFVLAVVDRDPQARFVGAYEDLRRNWERLLDVAELTVEERIEAEMRFAKIVGIWGRTEA